MIKNNPILVTGIIRSGTTWVGKVIATANNTLYIHELTNPGSAWNACFPTPLAHYYINKSNGGPFIFLFDRLANLNPICHGIWRKDILEDRRQFIKNHSLENSKPHLIIKDPTAIFSVNWFKKEFNTKAVFVLRHPISIVKSLVKLGWAKNYNPNIFNIQPLVRTDFYSDISKSDNKILDNNWNHLNEVEKAACFVRLLYLAICKYYREQDDYIFISYEYLVNNPEKSFMNLFANLDLSPSEKTIKDIRSFTEYDHNKAHQNSTSTINTLQKNILNSENGIDYKTIFNSYFVDIYKNLENIVDWEN